MTPTDKYAYFYFQVGIADGSNFPRDQEIDTIIKPKMRKAAIQVHTLQTQSRYINNKHGQHGNL